MALEDLNFPSTLGQFCGDCRTCQTRSDHDGTATTALNNPGGWQVTNADLALPKRIQWQ